MKLLKISYENPHRVYRIWILYHLSVTVGCRAPAIVDCIGNVVSEECGEEIAGQMRALGTEILQEIDCTTHKRQLYITRLFEYQRSGW